MKHCWKFWTMLQLGSLESWLEVKAQQGWILTGVQYRYRFTFKQDVPNRISYVVDYRGYLLEDYMAELSRLNWTMLKLSKYWLVWYKPYVGTRPFIKSMVDDEILVGIKRTTTIQLVVIVCCLLFGLYLNSQGNYWLFVGMLVVTGAMTYNLFRLLLYRAMVEVRNEQ